VSATNFFTGNPDLVEVFDKVIPWARVVGAVEGPGADVAGTVSTWREVLDLAGRYIATEIAPRAAKVDELGVIRDGGEIRMNEPMTKNLRGLADLGLASPSVPAQVGGAGKRVHELPVAVPDLRQPELRDVARDGRLHRVDPVRAQRVGDLRLRV